MERKTEKRYIRFPFQYDERNDAYMQYPLHI